MLKTPKNAEKVTWVYILSEFNVREATVNKHSFDLRSKYFLFHIYLSYCGSIYLKKIVIIPRQSLWLRMENYTKTNMTL